MSLTSISEIMKLFSQEAALKVINSKTKEEALKIFLEVCIYIPIYTSTLCFCFFFFFKLSSSVINCSVNARKILIITFFFLG